MKRKSDIINLAKLTAIQIGVFIIFEVIVFLLIAIGVVPASLMLTTMGVLTLRISTVYLVLAGLVIVLVSAFWLAILVHYNIVEVKDIDLGFRW
ncbi:MAG: hypothetical protein J7K68_04570 [Candidatus Diapherotrites archaeon]|nr:hypothetical protein [Candidatus Diapherotrites archaeon]